MGGVIEAALEEFGVVAFPRIEAMRGFGRIVFQRVVRFGC